MKFSVPVYGPLSHLKESSPLYRYPEVLEHLLLLSSGDWFMKEKSGFAAGYHEKFGTWPIAQAAYAYDAMTIMINAVKAAGADREKVQKALMATEFRGATGNIKFDEKGNRICTFVRAK
jgi:ABC-type branched-subunit amino acid transport system substrate-binding protein